MRTLTTVQLGLLVACCATSALAAQRVLIVGAGDCREPVLTTALKEFNDTARPQLKGGLFEPEEVLAIVRPRPAKSVQDLQRQVDSARTLLYGGQNDRGLEVVKQAIGDLELASPQANPWPVLSAALLVQSQLFKNLERTKEMNEAYRRVLRIDPGFKLDPDAYPPSTLQAFEAVRKELAKAKKATLQVQSTPPGASVFIDGRELGKTPAKIPLAPGFYRLALRAGDRESFPRSVEVKKEELVQVDMGFEGAVSLQPPLCVAAPDDDEALKLGAAVSADQVIVVRNTASAGNPPYISAVLYDSSGRRERNGGAGRDYASKLATFILTGKGDPQVFAGATEPPKVAAAVVSGQGDNKSPASEQTPTEPVKPAEKPAEPPGGVEAKAGPSGVRIASYLALAVGGATALVGIIVFGAGAADRDRLAALTTADGKLYPPTNPYYQEALTLMPKVDANRTLAFTLLGAGIGVAAAGALGVFLFPQSSAQVAFFPTTEGGAVALSGRF
ncbi:MAG: PEGA domain-containing protein [Myxococcota bacterium]